MTQKADEGATWKTTPTIVVMPPLVSVSTATLALLSADRAVETLRSLLWAEAYRLGANLADVNVPSAVTTGDGGIDAEMRGGAQLHAEGLIQPGWNTYQVKTGPYNIHQKAKVRDLLFDRVPQTRGTKASRTGQRGPQAWVLKPRVHDCFEKAGTFHAVLFGFDLPHPDGDPIDLFHTVLREYAPQYASARIKVVQANTLVSLLDTYPALIRNITGLDLAGALSHAMWARQTTMSKTLHSSPEVDGQLAAAQQALRERDQAIHIRILGEAGIGKTRFALELTREEDLQPFVLYCDSPLTYRASGIGSAIVQPNAPYEVILVIDECDASQSAALWNELGGLGRRVRLITIHNSPADMTSGTTIRVDVPPLPDEQIQAIFLDQVPEAAGVERWVALCGGSPRVAQLLAQNLRLHPQDMLRAPDDVDVWTRLVAADADPDSPNTQQRLLVLRHLALFERFGFRGEVAHEARIIASMAQSVDPSLTWPRFAEIVEDLRARKLLQGDTTLYITPKALHVRMWADWWNRYGMTFEYDRFRADVPPELLNWFENMFRYADASSLVQDVVRQLLGPSGPLQRPGVLLSGEQSDFFLALAEANPEAALRCLERTIGAVDRDSLRAAQRPRRAFVRALEMAAMWHPLFTRSAELLLKLAAAENETWSNNATGEFTKLFSLGYGPMAPTEAPPGERFALLERLLDSVDPTWQRLAVQALSVALSNGSGMRIVGPEQQGLRPVPNFWHPQTYGELFDAYRQAWALTVRAWRSLQPELHAQAREVLIRQAEGVFRMANLSEMVVDTVEALVDSSDDEERGPLLTLVEHLERRTELDNAVWEPRLEALRRKLDGEDFPSRLHRWVGSTAFEDQYDRGGGEGRLTPAVRGLVDEVMKEPTLLDGQLPWLSSRAAAHAYLFGYELALKDSEERFLPSLRFAQNEVEGATPVLLAGYLRALGSRDDARLEELLDELASEPDTQKLLGDLTFRTRLSERAGWRLLALIEAGSLPAEELALFQFGRDIQSLSRQLFNQWIKALVEADSAPALTAAVVLLDNYFIQRQQPVAIPQALALRVLKRALTVLSDKGQWDVMDDHHWMQVARALFERRPKAALTLAKYVLQQRNETLWQHISHSEILQLLSEAASAFPRDLWPTVVAALEDRRTRGFYVQQWLHGEVFTFGERPVVPGALIFFPRELLWTWAERDLDGRAWRLAALVPPTFEATQGMPSLASELLSRYGDRDDVARNLAANFFTGSWTGNASDHHARQAADLRSVLASERNERVRRWLIQQADDFDERAARERVQEERGEW